MQENEHNAVVYQGSDGIYRKVWIVREVPYHVAYMQKVWKGKQPVKEVLRSRHPLKLLWDGCLTTLPRIIEEQSVTKAMAEKMVYSLVVESKATGSIFALNLKKQALTGADIASLLKATQDEVPRYYDLHKYYLGKRQDGPVLTFSEPCLPYATIRDELFDYLEKSLIQFNLMRHHNTSVLQKRKR